MLSHNILSEDAAQTIGETKTVIDEAGLSEIHVIGIVRTRARIVVNLTLGRVVWWT
jgi:hypothetical protein